jgi:2-succinyl-5-enolpyruvyl-6-hydroxy-3-cyclohexene-1-carboxylate synthase
MMNRTTGTLQAIAVRAFVEELKRQGVTQFFASPGNRSALLIEAIVDNPDTSLRIHYDERGAAYMALGYGRAQSRPAALITTSGGAVANCFPAVVEAAKDRVPLVIVTADRPSELRYTGANQTIDQVKIFGNYVKEFIELPPPTEEIDLALYLSAAAQAFFLAERCPRGPVHINYMLREPFFSSDVVSQSDKYAARASSYFCQQLPFVTKYSVPAFLEERELFRLKETLAAARKGLVIVGKLEVSTDRNSLTEFLTQLGWPVLADITSGLRHFEELPQMIPYYDQILLGNESQAALGPDCVLHLGAQLVSKRLQKFLEASKVRDYIQVGSFNSPHDPGYLTTQFIECDPVLLCEQLFSSTCELNQVDKGFLSSWLEYSKIVEVVVSDYCLSKANLDEIVIPYLITSEVGQKQALFLGSSMPIRDFDMYSSARKSFLTVESNRGASGIDGNLATAAGFAMANDCPVTVVLGDLAFLHDLNSLELIRQDRQPIVVVVVNNDGGGIFSFVDVAAKKNLLDPYFSSPHGLVLEPFVRGFGLSYETCSTKAAFIEAYSKALSRSETTVVEIFTNREENFSAHKALQTRISNSLITGCSKDR